MQHSYTNHTVVCDTPTVEGDDQDAHMVQKDAHMTTHTKVACDISENKNNLSTWNL